MRVLPPQPWVPALVVSYLAAFSKPYFLGMYSLKSWPVTGLEGQIKPGAAWLTAVGHSFQVRGLEGQGPAGEQVWEARGLLGRLGFWSPCCAWPSSHVALHKLSC